MSQTSKPLSIKAVEANLLIIEKMLGAASHAANLAKENIHERNVDAIVGELLNIEKNIEGISSLIKTVLIVQKEQSILDRIG